MTRLDAIEFVVACIDSALSTEPFEITQDVTLVGYNPSPLVGAHEHDDPVVVACRACTMDTAGNRDILDDEDELANLAIDAINEKFPGTFEDGDPIAPDFIIVGTRGAPTLDETLDVISDLCEWEASMGFDTTAPEWDRARDLFERLMDQRDARDHHAKLVALENDRDGAL